LTLAEIGNLTPYQVREIYCHARDRKTGRIEPEIKGPGAPSYKEFFWRVWSRRGLPDYRIADKWKEYQIEQRKHPGRI
jgi:hypothetical protein